MSRCEACPVPEDLTCYELPGFCARAAQPGEDVFRGILVKHAQVRAAQVTGPRLLSAEEHERLRKAESCPYRDCVGCGCKGCRCKEGGRRPSEIVNIGDCLACASEGAIEPSPEDARV